MEIRLKRAVWPFQKGHIYFAQPVEHRGEERIEVYSNVCPVPGRPITLITTVDDIEIVAR